MDMYPDSVKTSLESTEVSTNFTFNISLRISAHLTKGDVFDRNTLEFDCDPKGSNYRRTYLRVILEDWSKVIEIRDFLVHYFSDNVINRSEKTIEVESGTFVLRPFEGEGHEKEELNEFTIIALGDRIEFGGMAAMTPHFHTYERVEDGEVADTNNAEKILDFFNEIIDLHPNYQGDKRKDPEVGSLFKEHRTESQLNSIAGSDSSLFEDYQKAVREFENEEFEDSIRDIGRAAETLIELLCERIYDEDNFPDNTGGRLNKLDNTESDIRAMVGKTISPLWWLRNKVNHPSEYQVTRDDAHYALLCFQIALEKYAEDFVGIEYK